MLHVRLQVLVSRWLSLESGLRRLQWVVAFLLSPSHLLCGLGSMSNCFLMRRGHDLHLLGQALEAKLTVAAAFRQPPTISMKGGSRPRNMLKRRMLVSCNQLPGKVSPNCYWYSCIRRLFVHNLLFGSDDMDFCSFS